MATCSTCRYLNVLSEQWHEYECEVDDAEVELTDKACDNYDKARDYNDHKTIFK